MAGQEYNIRSVLDLELWEQIQNQLAKLTGTTVFCIDSKGVPITKASRQSEFCRAIQQNPAARDRCSRCDTLVGLEAMRLDGPCIYLCHCGIVDAAVPIRLGNTYLGAVIFGQVRVSDNDSDVKLERLIAEASSIDDSSGNECEELRKLYEAIPELSYSTVKDIAELISSIVNYIVRRVEQHNNEKKDYEWILGFGDGQHDVSEQRVGQFSESDDEEENIPVPNSSAIYPALVYIRTHLKETITMKDMAALCHLSPSYFSRLFGRQMGENFVSYVNHEKIQLAKRMLMGTKKSISKIAAELSYQDASHFINLFKRFEGTTPQAYRLNNCD